MPDRRYTDDEVAEIFRRATTAPPPRHAGGDGMSLAELQDIGREVGIAPETVTAAARSIDTVEPLPAATLLGLPIAVEHSVQLEGEVSDAEWDRLVVAARETFRAEGRLRHEGSFRQWSNGNLKVLLEPTGAGHRLRFQTLNGHARRMLLGGTAALAIGGVFLAVPYLTGVPIGTDQLEPVVILGLIGAAMVGRGLWGLRAWAARREAQFRELAARVTGRG